jgi:hypothetical protein
MEKYKKIYLLLEQSESDEEIIEGVPHYYPFLYGIYSSYEKMVETIKLGMNEMKKHNYLFFVPEECEYWYLEMDLDRYYEAYDIAGILDFPDQEKNLKKIDLYEIAGMQKE